MGTQRRPSLSLRQSLPLSWAAMLPIVVVRGQERAPDAPVSGRGGQNLNPEVSSPAGWGDIAITETAMDPHSSSFSRGLAQVGSTLLFMVGNEVVGRELWKTDDTPLVKEIAIGAADSTPARRPAAGVLLRCTADDG